MADFTPCYEKMIQLEGGYHLHKIPGDRGGTTYAGIARRRWPSWEGWKKVDGGQFDPDLTATVRAFYKKEFWDRIRGDGIKAQGVAWQIFDFSVNAGLKTAVRMAQRVVGATPDGIFGDQTFARINAMVQDEKDERIFLLTFSLFKVFRYKDICLNDDRRHQDTLVSNQKFLCGWINRVQKGLES